MGGTHTLTDTPALCCFESKWSRFCKLATLRLPPMSVTTWLPETTAPLTFVSPPDRIVSVSPAATCVLVHSPNHHQHGLGFSTRPRKGYISPCHQSRFLGFSPLENRAVDELDAISISRSTIVIDCCMMLRPTRHKILFAVPSGNPFEVTERRC